MEICGGRQDEMGRGELDEMSIRQFVNLNISEQNIFWQKHEDCILNTNSYLISNAIDK